MLVLVPVLVLVRVRVLVLVLVLVLVVVVAAPVRHDTLAATELVVALHKKGKIEWRWGGVCACKCRWTSPCACGTDS
jgi:hypothetical protein